MRIISRIDGHRGYSSIITIVVITVFSFLSTTILDMTSVDSQIKGHEVQASQALLIGNAGIQYSLYKLNNGLSPNNITKNFNGGQFTISTNPAAASVTVESDMGPSKKKQSLSTNFSNQCTTSDLSMITVASNVLINIRFRKACHAKIILTGLVLNWTSNGGGLGNTITEIRVDNQTVYGPNGDLDQGDPVAIADKTIADSGWHEVSYIFEDPISIPNTFTFKLQYKDESEKVETFSL